VCRKVRKAGADANTPKKHIESLVVGEIASRRGVVFSFFRKKIVFKRLTRKSVSNYNVEIFFRKKQESKTGK
jgi:hypothetical protein